MFRILSRDHTDGTVNNTRNISLSIWNNTKARSLSVRENIHTKRINRSPSLWPLFSLFSFLSFHHSIHLSSTFSRFAFSYDHSLPLYTGRIFIRSFPLPLVQRSPKRPTIVRRPLALASLQKKKKEQCSRFSRSVGRYRYNEREREEIHRVLMV